MKKKLIIGLIAVVIIVSGYFAAVRLDLIPSLFSRSDYHAVFLSNGQVYFGQVSRTRRQYVKLTNIYYLIRKEPLQTQTPAEGEEATEATEEAQPEYTLVKLGNELHGPMDEMKINRQHVLFIENLKDDSKIVTAIKESQKKQD